MTIELLSKYWSQFLDIRMQTIAESRRDRLTWHQAADLLDSKLRSFDPPQHVWTYFQPIAQKLLDDWRSAPTDELSFHQRVAPNLPSHTELDLE